MGTTYIVSLSGGAASAVATERAIQRYGRDNVKLWIADTLWEDSDLWRFVGDCIKRWGYEPILTYRGYMGGVLGAMVLNHRGLVRHREGRTPLQVAEDVQIIPNSNIAPCTFKLKIEPFTRFLEAHPKPVTVLLGLGWDEQHRMAKPKARYEEIPGVTVDFPLMWKPYEFRAYQQVIKEDWGIEPPRLYELGFEYNNCGGRCVKQGQKGWRLLRHVFPERFAEVRDWEAVQRQHDGPRSKFAILKNREGGETTPLTLAELEQRETPEPGQPTQYDLFGCMCGYG